MFYINHIRYIIERNMSVRYYILHIIYTQDKELVISLIVNIYLKSVVMLLHVIM